MDNATMAPINMSDKSIICYAPTMMTTDGVWEGGNPLEYAFVLFIFQLTLVVLSTRFFVFILKPFYQPRVMAEIMVTSFLFHFLLFPDIIPIRQIVKGGRINSFMRF